MGVGYDSGMIFSAAIASVILAREALMGDMWFLMLQSAVIAAVSLMVFSYGYTWSISRPDLRLIRIALSILLLDSVLSTLNTPSVFLAIGILTSAMGLGISLMTKKRTKKRQVKPQEPRKIRRKEEIERELSDPWKEDPHIIYDPYELEKFDI